MGMTSDSDAASMTWTNDVLSSFPMACVVFLPSTMGVALEPHLPRILDSLFEAFTDDSEIVRETASRAANVITQEFHTSSLWVILPILEEGLFDPNWHIRQRCLQLLGDVLYRVSGGAAEALTQRQLAAQGKQLTREDVGADAGELVADDVTVFDTDAKQKEQMASILGAARFNMILAGLYMIRSDVNTIVRQQAHQVWSSLVLNTPRKLIEILDVLMDKLLFCLSDENTAKRLAAGRALGDLVLKLSDRVLPEVMPFLEKGLTSEDVSTRKGVCAGLSEVISSAGVRGIERYADIIVPAVRSGLVDREPEVRAAAAVAFDVLCETAEPEVAISVLPDLSDAAAIESHIVDGLVQAVRVRGAVVLPALVKQLLQAPVAPERLAALGAVSKDAGSLVTRFLGRCCNTLLGIEGSAEIRAAALEALRGVTVAVPEAEQQNVVAEVRLGLGAIAPRVRLATCELVGVWLGGKKDAAVVPVAERDHVIRMLITTLCDAEDDVQQAAIDALGAVVKKIHKDDAPQYSAGVHQALRELVSEASSKQGVAFGGADDQAVKVPGLCRKKALAPFMALLTQCVTSSEQRAREEAAASFEILIESSSFDVLKPFVIMIVGPLLRVVGDRYPPAVKYAILSAMRAAMRHGGPVLKTMFLPQLQTTMVKALMDDSRKVRTMALQGLDELVALGPRVDGLLNELRLGVASAPPSVAATVLGALAIALRAIGANASAPVRATLLEPVAEHIGASDAATRVEAGQCLAQLAGVMDAADAAEVVAPALEPAAAGTWQEQQGYGVVLRECLHNGWAGVVAADARVQAAVQCLLESETIAVHDVGVDCLGSIMLAGEDFDALLAGFLADRSSEVRSSALRLVSRLCRERAAFFGAGARLLRFLPLLIEGARSANPAVRSFAEKAFFRVMRLEDGRAWADEFAASKEGRSLGGSEVADAVARVYSRVRSVADDE